MSSSISHLLYLHGFRSSPQSGKARQVAAWVGAHRPDLVWSCPQLPASPHDAVAMIVAATAHWPHDGSAVIGSSLGGFYATALAERTGWPAVLLNPAVDPARGLADHIGATTAWHSSEPFVFRSEYIDELRALTPRLLTRPERYFAIIAKGDEVLSWHDMFERFRGSPMKLLERGDHALSDFDAHLADVVSFLRLL